MLVLCTGMPRSGSTWSFNVVRLLLAHLSDSVRSGYADTVGEALRINGRTAEHVVVKCHVPDDIGRALIKQRACRTIYTYRDPLDSVLSAVEAFKRRFDDQLASVRESLDLMRFQVEAGGVLCLWYDELITRDRDAVQAIADYLDLTLPAEAITEVAERLSRASVRRLIKEQHKSARQDVSGGASWDGGTLFSDRHMRANPSDPAQVFSAAQVALAVERLADYVDATAALRAPIRALGSLDGGRTLDAGWPSESLVATPVSEVAAPEAEVVTEVAAEAVAEIVADVGVAEFGAAAPEPSEGATVEAATVSAAAADAETAPAVDAAAPPTPAPPTPAPPTAAAPARPAPSKRPVAAFDPRAQAVRRALARDLLDSLGVVERGSSKVRGRI